MRDFNINKDSSRLLDIFTFPHPVNEIAARIVAAMVVLLCGSILITEFYWLVAFLVYGFLARVITGPTLSIFGLITTKIIVPALGRFGVEEKLVAGPPKRFAQTIGLLLSTFSATFYVFEFDLIANILISIILVFAILESCFSFCAGCYVFRYLMSCGLVPEEICEKCANINL